MNGKERGEKEKKMKRDWGDKTREEKIKPIIEEDGELTSHEKWQKYRDKTREDVNDVDDVENIEEVDEVEGMDNMHNMDNVDHMDNVDDADDVNNMDIMDNDHAYQMFCLTL